jgi:uncharacterized SAM-binding protein YcdF (DUF218 family)
VTPAPQARPRAERPGTARPRAARRARRPILLGSLAAGALGLGVLAAGEAISARAARTERAQLTAAGRAEQAGGAASSGGREVVVILGFGNPGRGINAVNRWRVEVGLRSRDPRASSTLVVMAGGAVHGEVSEAEHMARFARGDLAYDGALVLEDQSVTTWENVCNVLPLLEDAQRIVFASDPLHVLRAQGFLRTLRPDLADRLAPARDHLPGEQILRKPYFAVLGLEGLRRARRDGLMA